MTLFLGGNYERCHELCVCRLQVPAAAAPTAGITIFLDFKEFFLFKGHNYDLNELYPS